MNAEKPSANTGARKRKMPGAGKTQPPRGRRSPVVTVADVTREVLEYANCQRRKGTPLYQRRSRFFNNFHGLLPRAYRRFGPRGEPLNKPIIRNADSAIRKLRLDADAMEKFRKAKEELANFTFNYFNYHRRKELGLKEKDLDAAYSKFWSAEERLDIIDKVFIPLYAELRTMGYSHIELIG
ncbi:MAG: hypothetical protein HY544_03140 [Candidatus Diapherotrites archaeon]|uniref:Uncharacterized protein n=1 Tax=Candidatus Iainarchaeum sp. TaxID=3101447 RepID=A0A8T3YJQ5_9ARCH|nr:hypothetical protein [Candidatus Diapherotrites archaeon]